MAAWGKFFAVSLRICAHVLFLRHVFVFVSAQVKGHRINPPLVSSCLIGLRHVNENECHPSSTCPTSLQSADTWRLCPIGAIKNLSLYREGRSSGLLRRCCRCGPTKLKADGKSPWIQIQRMTKSPRPFWALQFVFLTTGPFVNSCRKRTFYYFEQQDSRFNIERQIIFTNPPSNRLDLNSWYFLPCCPFSPRRGSGGDNKVNSPLLLSKELQVFGHKSNGLISAHCLEIKPIILWPVLYSHHSIPHPLFVYFELSTCRFFPRHLVPRSFSERISR